MRTAPRPPYLACLVDAAASSHDRRVKGTWCLLLRGAAAAFLMSAVMVSAVAADGPQDNIPTNVRRIPKPGIEIPLDVRQRLEKRLADLGEAIENLKKARSQQVQSLLPDVQIYWQAVHDALAYNEFFDPRELAVAEDLLNEGMLRSAQLSRGEAPWASARGLVVRGYVSRIDGSVQPYGLVIPESYAPQGTDRVRLDLWFHGRGETLSEVNFLQQRRTQVGVFSPHDTIVLHPYGRYSNANKFAGEIDVFEALASVRERYRIDEDRISVRGFSMGGASTWHLAVHYPSLWFAANPGAGFAETPEFLRVFQQETLDPAPWERKLWHLYDCTDWAGNLRHCPTVAYSGEVDKQKQAADIMARALKAEGLELTHIIGPETGHKYHPEAAAEVERRMSALAADGRERVPRSIDFTTYTLRYNRLAWLRVDALGEHWERAHVQGWLDRRGITLAVTNVEGLTLDFEPGQFPYRETPRIEFITAPGASPWVVPASQIPLPRTDRSWRISLERIEDGWRVVDVPGGELRKRHGLQGPIDDAFLDAFVFVQPTGKGRNAAADQWARAEMMRAIEHWRRHFRGHPRVKADRDITDQDIADMNLVLWGDEKSNHLIARIIDQLPIHVDEQRLVVGDRTFDANDHMPILIYPNPLNPKRYVVLNSSFTFREFAYLNNARQVPKLPDWAIIDIRTPPDALWPGKVVAADFFDERWQVRSAQ